MSDRIMGASVDSEDIASAHFEADELAGFVLSGFNAALGKSNTIDQLDEHTRRVFAAVGGHVLERILARVGAPMRDISNPETKA